jgi:hypothetical protein
MPRESEESARKLHMLGIFAYDSDLAASLKGRPVETLRRVHTILDKTDQNGLDPKDVSRHIDLGFFRKEQPPERVDLVLRILEEAARRGHDTKLLSDALHEIFRFPSTAILLDRALPLLHANVRQNRDSNHLLVRLWQVAEKDFLHGRRYNLLLGTLQKAYREGNDPAPLAEAIGRFGAFRPPRKKEEEYLRALCAHASLAWTGGRKLPPHQLMEEAFHANSTIRNLPRTLKLQREILERTGVVPTREMIRAYWKARK